MAKKVLLIGTPLLVLALILLMFQTNSETKTRPKSLKVETLPTFNAKPLAQYNGDLTSRFKSSEYAKKHGLLSLDDILAKTNLGADQDGKVVAITLETYADYLNKNNVQDQSAEISPNQMLWIVTVDYPNGKDTKGGFYDKATANYAFDASTGREWFYSVTGNLQTSYHP